MKRSIAGLGLATLMATSLTGFAAAQSETPPLSDTATISIVVHVDPPVLAGYAASITGADGAVATVDEDGTLRISLPADVDPQAEIGVALTADAGASIVKVSANDATFDELVAALESVSVAPADRWAREIMEYRPYDTSDPVLTHLQDELAKYDPAPETLAGILSVLEP